MISMIERKNIPISKSILYEQEYRLIQSIRKRRALSDRRRSPIKEVRGRTISNTRKIRLEEVVSQ